MDLPNHRSSHQQATPRGGGVVIVVLVLLPWLIYILLNRDNRILYSMLPWVGALILAMTGWADDRKNLSCELRLTIHSIVALLGMLGLGAWDSFVLPAVGRLSLGWLEYPLTFLWIVGLVNAYNFMDGIDGIASSQAVISGTGWFLLGLLWGNTQIALLGLVLAAASLGFLFHNWHPARIFMGDVASCFLGYLFAILPLMCKEDNVRAATLLPGILLVWPFLFDTILTFLRRAKNGENVLTAHCSHLYQRLVISGLSHPAVTLLYAVLASLGLMFALAAQWEPAVYVGAACTVVFCGVLLIVFVRKRERA